MARPYPLTDPQGRTHLFVCGRCGHVAHGSSRLVEIDGPDEVLVESSREAATRCCTCKKCGAEIGLKYMEPRVCEACRPAYDAERAAKDAEWAAHYEAAAATLEASLTKALDVDAATKLRDTMSDISERCYCAGWLDGLEFTLWHMLDGTDKPGPWGQDEITTDDVAELRRLHEKSGGWWRFDDANGELFVPTEVWTSNLILRVGAERSLGALVTATTCLKGG